MRRSASQSYSQGKDYKQEVKVNKDVQRRRVSYLYVRPMSILWQMLPSLVIKGQPRGLEEV